MLATQRGSAHYPSMLEDVDAHRPTEIDLITGALVREAERRGVPVPLHTAHVPADQGEGGVLAGTNDPYNSTATGGRTMRGRTRGRRSSRCSRRCSRPSRSSRASASAATAADRDRLGVRQQGRDGAVRRARARCGAAAGEAAEREGRRRRPPARASTRATRRATSPHREVVRGEAARPAARTSSSRRATSISPRPSCRRRSTAASLAVAPCIGTDQMGPKRFGAEGPPRLHVRQRRPGRRLGDGRVRVEAGLALGVACDRHRDRLLPNVVQAFEARLKQLGGQIVTKETLPVARRRQRRLVAERRHPAERPTPT